MAIDRENIIAELVLVQGDAVERYEKMNDIDLLKELAKYYG